MPMSFAEPLRKYQELVKDQQIEISKDLSSNTLCSTKQVLVTILANTYKA